MSESLKEHAWKTKRASITKRHRNTSSRNRFNNFPLQDALQCDSLSASTPRPFRAHLTQFLHAIPVLNCSPHTPWSRRASSWVWHGSFGSDLGTEEHVDSFDHPEHGYASDRVTPRLEPTRGQRLSKRVATSIVESAAATNSSCHFIAMGTWDFAPYGLLIGSRVASTNRCRFRSTSETPSSTSCRLPHQ